MPADRAPDRAPDGATDGATDRVTASVGSRSSTDARAHDASVRTPREHDRAVRACTRCALHAERTTAVVGDGPADARLMIVGPPPRRHEDLQGRALAGGARNVLDAALLEVGLAPDEVRVTSAVRCRPPDDRALAPDELRACASHLRAELAMVAPEVIVSLGALATSVLLGRPVPLARVVGYRLDVFGGTTLIPTHNPVDAVRGDPHVSPALRRDLGVARAVLDGRMGTGAQAIADLRSRLAAGG